MSDKEHYTQILNIERRYREDMKKYSAIACGICALGATVSCSGVALNVLSQEESVWLAGYGICTLGFCFFGYKFYTHFKELSEKSEIEINYEEVLKELEEKAAKISDEKILKNGTLQKAPEKSNKDRSR